MFAPNNAPQTFTSPKSTTETVDGSVKHVQSKQQIHQNDVIESLWCLHHQLGTYPTTHSNCSIFDFEEANVCWATIISRENTTKVKSAEVY